MTDDARQDEMQLIDFLLGRLDESEARSVRVRLETDADFRRRHDDLKHAFQALDLAPQPQAPDDLADRTLQRIASVQRTNALLALQQAPGRGFRSTFSLKELAAVAAMLLVMAGVLIPALNKAKQRSQESFCAMQMGQIGNALQTYAINQNNYLPNSDSPGDVWLRQDDRPPTSNSAALFKLLRERYLSSPVVFQCPSIGGPSFVLERDMTDFPRPEHISYSYQYSIGGKSVWTMDPQVAPVAQKMAILADQSPIFPGARFFAERLKREISENHASGQNVLYLDGHVSWETSAEAGVEGDNIFLARGVARYTGREAPADATDSFLLPAHPGNP